MKRQVILKTVKQPISPLKFNCHLTAEIL